MSFSRREMGLILPALAAAAQQPVTNSQPGAKPMPVLASAPYNFEKLPVRTSASGAVKSRPVFDGVTGRGQHLSLHISELAPGEAPHAPARQHHEEVIVIREGTLEVTLNGQKTTLGPGSVIFSNFDDLNGWRNVGTTPAQYYVLSLEEHLG